MGNETLVPVSVSRAVTTVEPLDAKVILGRRDRIVDVMKTAMRDGVDYGKIPGTPKPGLWQPGAEKLSAMFGIAVIPAGRPSIDRVGSEVTIWTTLEAWVRLSDGSERKVAERTGVASSGEKKWRWKRTYDPKEFDATPEDERQRITKKGQGNSTYEVLQIRQSTGDILNTLVQMSHKRAFVPLVREVTGASDVFSDPETPPGDEERGDGDGEAGSAGRRSATRRSAPKQDAPREEPPKEEPAGVDSIPWPMAGRFLPVLDLKESPEKPGIFGFHLSPEDLFLVKNPKQVHDVRLAAAEPDSLGVKVVAMKTQAGPWKVLSVELGPLAPAAAAAS